MSVILSSAMLLHTTLQVFWLVIRQSMIFALVRGDVSFIMLQLPRIRLPKDFEVSGCVYVMAQAITMYIKKKIPVTTKTLHQEFLFLKQTRPRLYKKWLLFQIFKILWLTTIFLKSPTNLNRYSVSICSHSYLPKCFFINYLIQGHRRILLHFLI